MGKPKAEDAGDACGIVGSPQDASIFDTDVEDQRGILMMMMIAFITINSGLIPLIEGLCAQILYFRFEIIHKVE